jgi:hypothetical protein
MSDTNDVAVRAPRAEDAAQWRALRLEALRTCPTAFAMSYEDALPQDVSVFASLIAPSEGPNVLGKDYDDALMALDFGGSA